MLELFFVSKEKFKFLIKHLFLVAIILTTFFHLFEIKDNYYSAIANHRIRSRIEARAEECGKDYFISWLVFDGNKTKDKYYFKDVIGCNPKKEKKDCAFSVKDAKLNPFYNAEYHRVDKKTYEFLEKMETGNAGIYDNLDYFKDYPAINDVLHSTNKKIERLGISITRDIRKNVVYVFTITNVSKNNQCDRHQMTDILEDLSIYAKDNL